MLGHHKASSFFQIENGSRDYFLIEKWGHWVSVPPHSAEIGGFERAGEAD